MLTTGLPSIREMLNEDAHDGTLQGSLIKNMGRDLLDGISKANELCFTLWGKRAAPVVQMVHCDAANFARDDSRVSRHHREFKRHAVGVITNDNASRERHVKGPPAKAKRMPRWASARQWDGLLDSCALN